jgi:hypothetical protein
MLVTASWPLRLLYCLALLSAMIPFGISGYVVATFGGRPTPLVPYAASIALLFLGLWRLYLVARHSSSLDSYVFDVGTRALRILGIVAMVVGVVYMLLKFGGGPLVKLLRGGRQTESGVEFYVVQLYLTFISGVGPIGILLFEASRIFGFERNHRRQKDELSPQTTGS